jgi:hypothetical protein
MNDDRGDERIGWSDDRAGGGELLEGVVHVDSESFTGPPLVVSFELFAADSTDRSGLRRLQHAGCVTLPAFAP